METVTDYDYTIFHLKKRIEISKIDIDILEMKLKKLKTSEMKRIKYKAKRKARNTPCGLQVAGRIVNVRQMKKTAKEVLKIINSRNENELNEPSA